MDSRVVVVKLRRNFGQTSALAAGFDHAQGEYIIAMDGDLQHDPEDIPKFLEKLAEGYDIVSGWRKRRQDNLWMRRIPSRCANWMMAKLSGVSIHDFGTTFKAYRRDMLQQIPLYGEMHRFIPALASWLRRHHVRSAHPQRPSRARQLALRHLADLPRLLRPADHPLPAALSLAPAALLREHGDGRHPDRRSRRTWLAVIKFMHPMMDVIDEHGPFVVFSAVLIVAGVQMLALGLLGEMQARHYHEPSRRLPYSVERLLRSPQSEQSTLQE